MKILILSQVFWPDTASTSQHLSDLAFKLAEHHEVKVFTSRHDYEDPQKIYPSREIINGVSITRLNNTAFGKKHIIGRVVDFFSFNMLLAFRLISVGRKRADIMIGMTSPPLISFIGILFAKLRGIRFFYWTMDLQPELSIASDLMRENSYTAKLFSAMGNYVFRHSSAVIVLDKYMKAHAVKRGADEQKTHIVPVWPVLEKNYGGDRDSNPFRVANNFGDRIVVMYSGNHSYIHPLNTLLEAALILKNDPRFLFAFIGGGVRKKDVGTFRQKHQLDNIVQLNYQPRNSIHLSLAAADLQVVILGNGLVGFTHPNKVYGSMFAAKPILYIGPPVSHIAEIITEDSGNICVEHGDVTGLVQKLKKFSEQGRESWNKTGLHNQKLVNQRFSPEELKSKMFDIISNS